MMRYSFDDFLKYQNKLNDKYDEEKIECMIDGILQQLRSFIEQHPTAHMVSIFVPVYDDSDFYDICRSSLAELQAISNYLENMGFTVEWRYAENNKNKTVVGFEIKW